MNLELKGKVALIGGSGSGLGRAIAEELAAEGAAIVLCGRRAAELTAAREDIARRFGVETLANPADLATAEGVREVTGAALKQFGHVDILVTNVGGPPAGTFEELTPEQWDAAYRLTLASAVNLVRALLPPMKQCRWGRILNVTSIAVRQPLDNLMLSNSLRAAVTGFARTLANEVAPHGITVNNVLPGYTMTDRLDHLAAAAAEREQRPKEEVIRRWQQQVPAGRLGEPREFAALVAFLASARAGYITGTSIAVDGGWTRALY